MRSPLAPGGRDKKEAAPKGGFRFLRFGLWLEEDHATELEEIEAIEALAGVAATIASAEQSPVVSKPIRFTSRSWCCHRAKRCMAAESIS